MKITYTPQAASDLAEIFDYIQERPPPGAQNVKRSIYQSIGLLEILPRIGVRTDIPKVRMLAVPRYPYLIFYTFMQNRGELVILSVRHAARKR